MYNEYVLNDDGSKTYTPDTKKFEPKFYPDQDKLKRFLIYLIVINFACVLKKLVNLDFLWFVINLLVELFLILSFVFVNKGSKIGVLISYITALGLISKIIDWDFISLVFGVLLIIITHKYGNLFTFTKQLILKENENMTSTKLIFYILILIVSFVLIFWIYK